MSSMAKILFLRSKSTTHTSNLKAVPSIRPCPGCTPGSGILVQDAETAIVAKAYQLCMSGNANLLMNLAPDNIGWIPSEAADTTHAVAKRIRPE